MTNTTSALICNNRQDEQTSNIQLHCKPDVGVHGSKMCHKQMTVKCIICSKIHVKCNTSKSLLLLLLRHKESLHTADQV